MSEQQVPTRRVSALAHMALLGAALTLTLAACGSDAPPEAAAQASGASTAAGAPTAAAPAAAAPAGVTCVGAIARGVNSPSVSERGRVGSVVDPSAFVLQSVLQERRKSWLV